MKKNILTIVVIVLCVLNLVLSALVVFTVVPAANKTTALINQIASIVDLELESPDPRYEVAMADLTAVEFDSTLTINLKITENDKTAPFAIIDAITVYLNKNEKDYETLNSTLKSYATTISEIVTDTYSKYTKDEAQNNRDLIKQEILSTIQKRFASVTIADISFKNLRFQ